ncbi:aquaporin NIP6-1-like [Vigna umbellata]|uniref:aquaporin NIP6-1-like n=1 Tax=Vigna umbellata TaxID=87088 RepID=UPI001F5E556B|nr:aquaporin NIP6-1-like [Vigna umbellata]
MEPYIVSCSLSFLLLCLWQKGGAEFHRDLILMFVATAAAIVNEKTNGSETLLGCAATTGLAVMILIFAIGHISGAHFNPAVTLSFATLKHFPGNMCVPMYIGAQILASICAAFALKWVYHPFMSGGVTVPSGGYVSSFALEFIIAFNLMFVVTAVTTNTRAVGELAGIAVGGTVMLNIMIAGPVSGASMNPVRTLGPAIAAKNYKAIWIYLVASVFGALAGACTYTVVKLSKEDDAKEKTSISFRE